MKKHKNAANGLPIAVSSRRSLNTSLATPIVLPNVAKVLRNFVYQTSSVRKVQNSWYGGIYSPNGKVKVQIGALVSLINAKFKGHRWPEP